MQGSFRHGVVAVAVAAASVTVPLYAGATVKTRTLATMPANFKKHAFAVTTDGNEVAFVERSLDGQRVVFRGQRGPFFPEVAPPQIAQKSNTLFYWGGDPKTGAADLALIANGERITPGFVKGSEIFFSDDGEHWATAGAVASGDDSNARPKARVIVDGKIVGTHKDVTWPVFSPDNRHVAYIAQQDDDSFRLIIDGAVKWSFEKPEVPSAAAMTQGDSPPSLAQVFMLKYLSNGSLLFMAQDRDGWAVYRDGTRLATYGSYRSTRGGVNFDFGQTFRSQPAIVASWFGTAEKAPIGAWWERIPGEETHWRIMRDGVPMQKTCAHFWEGSPAFLSDDGAHIAYQCPQTVPGVGVESKLDMMYDETVLGTYYNVYGIGFSDNGSRIAYAASTDNSEDGWHVYLHGRYFAMRYVEIWRPRITPDGKHVAWEGKRGKRGVLVIDGDSRASFDDVLWGPEFLAPDTVSWVIRRGTRILRVDASY